MDNNYNPLSDNDNENKNSIDENENLHTDETTNEIEIPQAIEDTEKNSKKPLLFIALAIGFIAIASIVLAIIFSGGSDNENSSDSSDESKSTSSYSEETTVSSDTTKKPETTATSVETKAPETTVKPITTPVETKKPDEITTKKETKKDTIYYETKYEYDNTLEEGKEKTKQEGKNGYKSYEREVTYLNGQVTKTGEWKLVETVKATNQILIKGTKKKVEPYFGVKEKSSFKINKNNKFDSNISRKFLDLRITERIETIKGGISYLVETENYNEMCLWLLIDSRKIIYDEPIAVLVENNNFSYIYFEELPEDIREYWISYIIELETILKEMYPDYLNLMDQVEEQYKKDYNEELNYKSFLGNQKTR